MLLVDLGANGGITAFSGVEGEAVAEENFPTTELYAVAQLLPATSDGWVL
jgi:hypothetical protein